jgi:hypothetical protein
MDAYGVEVCKLEGHFEGIVFHHVCRDNNIAADVPSKLGSKCLLVLAGVFVQDLRKTTIKLFFDLESPADDTPLPGGRDVLKAEAEDDWLLDFIAFPSSIGFLRRRKTTRRS